MCSSNVGEIIGYGKLNGKILKLSVPAIVSNITVPLLGICDTAISGHLGDARYLGAIAVASMMMNVITWLVGFLRMGTTGMVAMAYGRGDDQRIKAVFTFAVSVATMVGIVAILLRNPLLKLLLYIVSADSQVALNASQYFIIAVYGLPASLIVMAVSGWFVGRQSTLYPMIIAISTNIINILLSFILAFPAGLGFRGIAIGTCVANWLGLFISLFLAYYTSGKAGLFCSLKTAYKAIDVRRFFSVNGDLFLRSACVMSVSMSMTAFGARLGDLTLAANAVMLQFFTFFSFFMDGFAFSGEALCGKYAGAGNYQMLLRSIKALLMWSLFMAMLFTILYMSGWKMTVDLLTNVEAVKNVVAEYKLWLWLIPATTVAAFIFDGFYIGLTRTKAMLYVTLTATIIFFLLTIVSFNTGDIRNSELLIGKENNILWIAFLSYLAFRGLGLGLLLPRTIRNENFGS